MAITKDPSRQYALTAQLQINEADMTALGLSEAVELPQNSIVTGGYIAVTTAFDAGVAQTLALSGGGVTVSAFDADTAGSYNALTLDGTINTAGDTVDVTLGGAAGAAGDAGVATLVIEYVIVARENEVQDEPVVYA